MWGHLTRAIRALRDMEAEAQRAVTAGPRGGPSVAGALLAQVEALVTWMGGEVPGPAAGAEAEGAAGDGGEGAGRRPGRLASIFWGLLVKEQLGKGTQPPRHNADRRTGFAAELKREVVEGLWRKQNTTAASASPAAVAANAVQGAAALVEQLAVLALGVSVLLGLLASVALAYVVASAIRDPRRARRCVWGI